MTSGAERHRLHALAALGRKLPRTGSLEAAAHEVASAIGAGDLACCVVALEGDTGRSLAVSVGPGSGLLADADPTAGLLHGPVQIGGVPWLLDVVRQRAPFLGPAGAPTPTAIPAVVRQRGAAPGSPVDTTVAAVPVQSGVDVVAALIAWGPGCDETIVPLLEASAGMLALRWGADGAPGLQPQLTPRVPRRGSAARRRAVAGLLRDQPLRAALQPIVRLHDGAIMAWEALCRFTPTDELESAEDLFRAAAGGLEEPLDSACLRAGLQHGAHADQAPLFLNATIATLLAGDALERLNRLLAEVRLETTRVVLELSERAPIVDLGALVRATADLRAAGFRIAVEDAGSGHASMRVIAELRPDFIKIDRSLIHQLATNNARRALVVSLLSFGGHLGSRVIATGVETAQEKQSLSDLGVQYGQGGHLGMPVMVDPPPGAPATMAVDEAWFGEQRVVGFGRPAPDGAAALRLEDPSGGSVRARGRRSLAQALSDAARALQSEHDRQRILGVICEQLNAVVPVKEMVIYAADLETHRFVPLLATGPDAAEILADSFGLDSGITGWAFAQGVPQNVHDTSIHPLARQIPGTQLVEESMLLLPLVAGDRKLGIINCYRVGAGRFRASELKAASLFAHMVAAAWCNAELYSELVDAAMTDPLTTLFNTRWLHEAGARELAQSNRNGSPLAVLLLDLDHFKQVNDSCGHAAGDAILRRVARTLRSAIRRGDAAVRFGGEEFLVMLPDTDAGGAQRVAANLREAVRRLHVPDECALAELTTSIGIAIHPTHGHSLDVLIRAADDALYEAKNGGRDRVGLASTDNQPVPRGPSGHQRARSLPLLLPEPAPL
jgi:diguanylate cyclase (GGDEF)-like protein